MKKRKEDSEKSFAPSCYKEEDALLEPIRLSDEEYSRALNTFVVVCTDVCIIDRKEEKIYLAKRRARPASGKWWFIGGRSFAGEGERKSMARCFFRETNIEIAPERFEFVCMNRYVWKDREQAPINLGCDSLCYTFAIELAPDERDLVSRSLEANEYVKERGLRGFTKGGLVKEKVLPQLIDFFDKVFTDK